MGSGWGGRASRGMRELLLPVTRRSPWRTSCWWPFGYGAGGGSGVASGCWGLPGESRGCVTVGGAQGVPQHGDVAGGMNP